MTVVHVVAQVTEGEVVHYQAVLKVYVLIYWDVVFRQEHRSSILYHLQNAYFMAVTSATFNLFFDDNRPVVEVLVRAHIILAQTHELIALSRVDIPEE